jgi:hypothetical protein
MKSAVDHRKGPRRGRLRRAENGARGQPCPTRFATLLNGAAGEAIRGLMTETIQNPDLMVVIRQYFLVHRSPIPDRVLVEIVDDVIIPLICS